MVSNLNNLFGFLFVIIGALLGIYVGFWLLFIGSIVDFINILHAGNASAGPVFIMFLKWFFAAIAGWSIFGLGLIISRMFFIQGKKSG